MLENSRRYYYVDEAGDLTFFDKRGIWYTRKNQLTLEKIKPLMS